MRQLLPHPAEVEPAQAYGVERPRPDHRPWVAGLMVTTADGAAAVSGRSGLVGGEGDALVFRAVRAVADAIIVGAGTVRAEGYGPVRLAPSVEAQRRARGQTPTPPLVVVSARLDLDPTHRLFAEADASTPPPVLAHPPSAPLEARRRLEGVAELVELTGDAHGGVDATALVTELGRRGLTVVVAEGGPTLNGTLLAADVVDELCLTLDPMVVGGDAPRLAHHPSPSVPRAWRPAHLLEHDGVLFWRLLRERAR